MASSEGFHIVAPIIGVLMVIATGVQACKTREFVREAVATDGVVTKLNAGAHHPEIEFTTASGEHISYPQGGWVTHEVGDKVRVLYRRDDPHDAELDEFGGLYFGTGITAFLGIAFLGIGTVLLLKRRGR